MASLFAVSSFFSVSLLCEDDLLLPNKDPNREVFFGFELVDALLFTDTSDGELRDCVGVGGGVSTGTSSFVS